MKTRTEIALSNRWRGVVGFIENWIGPFESDQQTTSADLDALLGTNGPCLSEAIQEWCILTANWSQGGLNVWIPQSALAEHDGLINVLTDVEGICRWSVRSKDMANDDPPVIFLDESDGFQHFSAFVAAMVVSDFLFANDRAGEAIELKTAALTELTCFASANCGGFYADAALDAATLVAFAYPSGEVYGKSRTPAGAKLLARLRK